MLSAEPGIFALRKLRRIVGAALNFNPGMISERSCHDLSTILRIIG
jgi:hypothetical protein